MPQSELVAKSCQQDRKLWNNMPSFERDYEVISPIQGLGAKIEFVKQNNLTILDINILEKLLCQVMDREILSGYLEYNF